MLNEKSHSGGLVVSLVHDSALVAKPIQLVLNGQTTSVSLADALQLHQGLEEGIQRVLMHSPKPGEYALGSLSDCFSRLFAREISAAHEAEPQS